MTHVIPGYPSTAETPAIFDAMIEGGSDLIEVQIPFSDPLADGTTVQRGVFEALDNGTTPAGCIEFARQARARHPDVAIIYMSYLNPVLAYGAERFAQDAAAAGGDGIILVDLPPEEAAETKRTFDAAGLDIVFLVAPTSSDERLPAHRVAGGRVHLLCQRGRRHGRAQRAACRPARLHWPRPVVAPLYRWR